MNIITNKKNCNSKFYSVFFSYFLVFLIPASLISIFIFHIASDILKQEIQNNNVLTTQTAQYNLTQTLDSFSIVSNSIAYSNYGHAIDITKEVSTAMSLISYLNRTGLSYIFVEDIFFFPLEGDYVYSGQSSYTKDNFYQSFHFPNNTREELEEQFFSSFHPFFLNLRLEKDLSEAKREKDYLFYIIPCTRGEYKVGFIGFLIDIDSFNSFLGNHSSGNYLYVITGDSKVLNPPREEITALPLETASSIEEGVFSTSSHTFISRILIPDSLYLINVSSKEEALRTFNKFRALTLSIFMAVFFLGIACVILASLQNKHQWKRMEDFYKKELEDILPLKQKEILYALMNGNYLYPNDFQIQCEECGMDFHAKFHYCILILSENNEINLVDLLTQLSSHPISLCYHYMAESSAEKIVYFIGTDTKLPLQNDYYKEPDYIVFISSPTSHILESHLKYSDVASLMYLQRFSKSSALPEDNLYSKRLKHYENCLSKINASLSTSDFEGLTLLRQNLISDFKQDFISFDIKLKIVLQLYLMFSNKADLNFPISDILSLTSSEDIEQYIYQIFSIYFSYLEKKKENNNGNLQIEVIKEFIDKNYTDPMFSLQLIADEYHISASYLSWFFKQKMDMTVLDYTTDLKMKLATKLLNENLTLQDISLQVGYINVSSFIRRFKQTMGMTPGEYKKIHSEK